MFFDALSFSTTGQTATVDATANCLDMTWTGATNSPTLAGSGTVLSIYGSLTLITAMTITHNGTKTFLATTTGKTVTTAGVSLNSIAHFNSTTGGWTLQDNLTSTAFIVTAGAVDTNGKTVTCSQIRSNSTSTRSITLGASIINNSGDWLFDVTTGLTFSGGTSTINMTGNTKTFHGGGKTFYNVALSGTPTTITGSNTFTALTISAGKTVSLTSGTTQTATTLIANGTAASVITLQAVTAGSAATISVASGLVYFRHCSIKDITATGGASFTSIAGTNVSGNTGITFVTQMMIGQIKSSGGVNSLYWVNGSGVLTKISG